MTIRDAFADTFREWETDGLPASGAHKVSKAEARALGGLIEDSIAAVQLANAIDEKFETKALMDADTSQADGTMAIVFADPVADNNGYYYWVDADSEWVRSEVLNPTDALAGAIEDGEAAIAAAADVAIAEVVATPAMGGFDTVANGLTAAAEGQTFAQTQPSGIGQDWYRDISGAAHFLYSRPGPGGQFIADLTIHERSANLAVQYPWNPQVDIRWGDARIHNGAVAPNRSAWSSQPARTINAFTAGYFPNIGGSQTSPTQTSLYDEGQTAGADDAVHYSFGNNQVLYLLRAAPTVTDVPDQTITLVFDYRRNAVAVTDQSLQCGLSTALETITATASWQTKMKEITWAGVGDIVIRTAAYTAEVDLSRGFLWPGAAATVPAWATMNFVGGRRPFSFGDSLTMSGAAAVTASGGVGFVIYAKDYKTGGSTYDSPLIGASVQFDDINSAANNIIISTAEDDGHGTDDGDMQIFAQIAPGYEGQVAVELWSENTRATCSVDVRHGPIAPLHLWHDTVAGLKILFIDGVAARVVDEASSAFIASFFRAMSGNDSHNVEITSGNAPGRLFANLIDNVPSGASLAQVETLIRSQKEKLRLDPTITSPIGFLFHALRLGDSNDSGTQPAGGEHYNRQRRYDFLGGGRRVIPLTNVAVGGAGFTTGSVTFQEQMATGPNGSTTNPLCGGWAVIDSCGRNRKPCLTQFRGVTNDETALVTLGAQGFFDTWMKPFYDEVIERNDYSYLMIETALAKRVSGGNASFNDKRRALAELQLAYAEESGQRAWCVDIANHAQLGSDAEVVNMSSTIFDPVDGVHMLADGEEAFAEAIRPKLVEFNDYLVSQGFS